MNIGVFFGGRNPEHDVSIITGNLVIKGLIDLGHNVIPVYITKKGEWLYSEEFKDINYFKNLKNQEFKNAKRISLSFTKKNNGIVLIPKTLFSNEVSIELAFPALHGRNGEDGTIQGVFELLNIPYVGCNVTTSGITIDKVLTKLMYQRFNIPTAKFVFFSKDQYLENSDNVLKDIKANLPWPVIIKPSSLGSSIGISKANSDKELINAIEVALHYDTKVIVEELITDLSDLTIAVIGNTNPKASLIQESIFTKDLFTYEDKYISDGGAQTGNAEKKLVIPAELDKKTTEAITNMALEIYRSFECLGIARIDFLYNRTYKKFYANEINTLPGTIYHHLWKKSGMELNELLKNLIDYSLESFNKKEKLTYTFESSILSKANTSKMKLGE